MDLYLRNILYFFHNFLLESLIVRCNRKGGLGPGKIPKKILPETHKNPLQEAGFCKKSGFFKFELEFYLKKNVKFQKNSEKFALNHKKKGQTSSR
jgi:hypothetical protein